MKAIEVTNFPVTDYEPLVDYEGWRVAVLAFCENTTLPKIRTMQKHDYTDEVFVLIRSKIHALSTYPSGQRGQRRDCVKLLKAYINRSKSSLNYILNTS